MSRSLKKGPFVESKLLKKIEDMNKVNDKKVFKDLVQGINNFPANGWTYNRST